MKKTISLFSLFMLLATNFMPLVSFANETGESETSVSANVENEGETLTEDALIDNNEPKSSVENPTGQQNEIIEEADDSGKKGDNNIEKVVEQTTENSNSQFGEGEEIISSENEGNTNETLLNNLNDITDTITEQTNIVIEPPVTEDAFEEVQDSQVLNITNRSVSVNNVTEGCFILDSNDRSIINGFNIEDENCSWETITIPSGITKIGDWPWPYKDDKTGTKDEIEAAKEYNEGINELKKSIIKVELPDSLTYIGGGVFQGASNLSDINFPSSLIEIGEWAFQGTAITNADISNITEIKDGVFAATDKLQTITFSNNLTKIGKNAFQGSSAEMNITSNSIESIGEWAFASSNLKSIDLSKLKTISTGAFAWSKLENVEFNENLSFIGQQAFRGALSGDVELKNINCIEQQAFEGSRIGELRISGTNGSKIEMMAFKDAYIGDVYISGINKIGQQAFENVQMRNLEIIGDGETKIELMAFSKAQIKKIHIDNVEDIGQQAFETKYWVDEVIITGSQEGAIIHSMAFKNMNTWNLNLVNINNIEQQAFESNNIGWGVSIKGTGENSKISQNAFMNSSIGHIYVNDISSIGEQSFLNIKNVEEVVVMGINTQTAIANNAFSNLAYSGGISVKGNLELYNVTTIGEQSFGNMSNVKSVKVEGWSSPTYISNRAFTSISFTGDNGKLELNNVNNIGDQGFYNSKNIKTVTITGDQNNGLTIAERAFQGAELISLDLTNAKDLKHQAFFNVSGLELVNIDGYNGGAIIGEQVFESSPRTAIEGKEVVFNIGDKVTYIGKGAFQDSKATSINIEGATWNDSCNTDSTKNCGTVVEERALQGTTSLQNVTFGTGVTKIGDHQFVNSKVETVVIEGSEEYGTTIGKNAFQATQRQSDGLGTVKSITLGEGVTSLGEYAFMNTRITEITIPSTVNVIPEYSFVGVNTLTGVVISEGVKVIGKGAFIGTSLDHVYIGGSEEGTEIQENAFLNLGTLTSLDIEGGVSYIGQQAFQGTSITTIDIDGSKNGCTIDNGAFRNADSVTSIHLGTGVTVIQKQAFEALDSVTSITIDGAQEGTRIGEQAFHHAAQLQTVNLGSVARIDSQAFAVAGNLTTVNIKGPEAPSEGTVIGDQAFLGNALTSLNLGNIKEIGNAAFAKTTNKDAYTVISDTLALMGNNAFSYTNNVNVVIEADISSLTEEQIATLQDKNVNVIQGYRINFMNEGNLYYSALFAKGSDYILPYTPYKTGYELEGWTENGVDSLFHFDGNKINSNKTFNAKWKSIQEKVAETTKEESVVFLKHTNVTINGVAENVNIEDSADTVQLKTNNDVKQSSIFVDTGGNSTINEDLDVDVSKTVEYQGGVEIYFEIKNDNTTEVVNETAKFSVPIAVKVPVKNATTEYVKVKVKHEGDETYGYKGLTLNPENYCEMGEAIEDKYNGEGVEVINNNGERYVTIYACSASTFVAYTEDNIVIPTPSTGRGRPIVSATTEKEHNSADTNNQEETKETNIKTSSKVELNEKLQSMKLTRGEVAVMTNILLEVFPQLVEGRQELDDVTNACSNYADEQNFTKSEKKAITRLCKLSIMGIHNETKEPLDEFLVKQLAKNNEFSAVINRSIETYNEKDLTIVKDALKKLEKDEETVEFGTLYNTFMKIKSLLD